MDLLHSPPVDLQIRIDHCDYMHVCSRMGEIILKEFPASGIQDWELGPNCTGPNQKEEGSSADEIVLFLTFLKVTCVSVCPS